MLVEWLTKGQAVLSAEARAAVVAGVVARATSDGGFAGRDEASDLYYAPFALSILAALNGAQAVPAAVDDYVSAFGGGRALDRTHQVSLIQALALRGRHAAAREIALGLVVSSERSVYDAFLMALACQAVGVAPPEGSVREPMATPEIAASVALAAWRGLAVPAQLLRALRAVGCAEGGLRASVSARVPDLLSTATGLLALRLANESIAAVEARLHAGFATACWRDSGLFASSPRDPDPRGDVEYTFYALLTLGALA